MIIIIYCNIVLHISYRIRLLRLSSIDITQCLKYAAMYLFLIEFLLDCLQCQREAEHKQFLIYSMAVREREIERERE